MEKVGILGSAVVGQALAQGFKAHGYEVRIGWDPADMGTAVAARAIEPLCQLWCIPGFRDNHWTHAFKLLWD